MGIDNVTGRGKYIGILHDRGFYTYYSNLSEILVRRNDQVRQGHIIGRIDNTGTGNDDKPYLSWGLFRFNLTLNMLNVIREEDHHDFEFDDVNKYIYKTIEDNKIKFIRIIGYFGEGFKVNIPESINGFPVKEIWHKAFSDMGLIDVIIPEGVTYIGSSFNNNNLVSLKIPSTVEVIDKAAFAHNKLKRIMLLEGLKTIGEEAFYDNRLTNITIPSSVKNIKSWAFSHNKLTEVILPDITEIENSVFLDNNLRRITIPESVTSIGPSAFEDNKLRRITIPSSVLRIENRAFENNKLTNITIPPNSVIEIEPDSFAYNKLRAVELPECVRIIYGNAFGNNMNLKKITIGADVDLIKNTIYHDFFGNITFEVFDHNFDSFYSFIANKQSGTYVYGKKTGWKKEEK